MGLSSRCTSLSFKNDKAYKTILLKNDKKYTMNAFDSTNWQKWGFQAAELVYPSKNQDKYTKVYF